MLAYQRGDFATALRSYDRALRHDRFRTAENMVFYAILLTLNKKPVEQSLKIYTRVVAGEFSRGSGESPYARALARYWLSFLLNQQDVVARWLDAYALKPRKGWASSYLPLPDKPLLK